MKLSNKEQDFEIKYTQTKEERIQEATLKIARLNTWISVTMSITKILFKYQGGEKQIANYLALV